jgi:hypothetical protein
MSYNVLFVFCSLYCGGFVAASTAEFRVPTATRIAPRVLPIAQQKPLPKTGGLTPETLPAFLDQMGYTYKVYHNVEGEKYCQVTCTAGNVTVPVTLMISTSRAKLWFIAPLPAVVDETQIPVGVMQKMMAYSDQHGVMFFAHRKSEKRFVMKMPIENRDLTPRLFRADLDALAEQVKETQMFWDPKLWFQSPSSSTRR